jgi:hypothetical protein
MFISFTGLTQSLIVPSDGRPEGSAFLKRVENNLLNDVHIISGKKTSYMYNLESKTDIEKLIFGDFNAMVEFFISPSFEGAYGFRIVKDSLDEGYTIESKRISNWDTVWSQLSKEFPSISIKAGENHLTTRAEKDRIRDYNREIFDKQIKESFRRYEVITLSVSVSKLFTEKLYECINTAISHFSVKGTPASIMDGYKTILRCVVADEVWTLTIQSPQNELLQLTKICQQLVEDIKSKNVSEPDYITLFEKITQQL